MLPRRGAAAAGSLFRARVQLPRGGRSRQLHAGGAVGAWLMTDSGVAYEFLKVVAPPLDGSSFKGDQGRICVVGGSRDFTGAPFYAGMAALRTGAELVYVLTADEAAGPIKTYSPELMVSTLYNCKAFEVDQASTSREQGYMLERFDALANWRPAGGRFHSVILGPGLGRSADILHGIKGIILRCKERGVPMVIDADGLWLVQQDPSVVAGYSQCILTPNRHEFKLLAAAALGSAPADPKAEEQPMLAQLAQKLGLTVLLKGGKDLIASGSAALAPGAPRELMCCQQGGPRRSGGIGDVLSGCLGTLLAWTSMQPGRVDHCGACHAACTVVRRGTASAYSARFRAMTAENVLECLPQAFNELCPAPRL